MQKNLDVTKYRNGDTIPQATTLAELEAYAALHQGCWNYPEFNPANGPIYGKLYNWYAVTDPRGLAPIGYHVPSYNEFETLWTCLGGASIAGGKMKEAGTTHWLSPNTGATNSSGFTALPTGLYNSLLGKYTQFSTTDPIDSQYAYGVTLNTDNAEINNPSYNYLLYKKNGSAVRLIKD
jgi:uncharacterized protein (TIGR02145 family)